MAAGARQAWRGQRRPPSAPPARLVLSSRALYGALRSCASNSAIVLSGARSRRRRGTQPRTRSGCGASRSRAGGPAAEAGAGEAARSAARAALPGLRALCWARWREKRKATRMPFPCGPGRAAAA